MRISTVKEAIRKYREHIGAKSMAAMDVSASAAASIVYAVCQPPQVAEKEF